jgi:hypothetical protein
VVLTRAIISEENMAVSVASFLNGSSPVPNCLFLLREFRAAGELKAVWCLDSNVYSLKIVVC